MKRNAKNNEVNIKAYCVTSGPRDECPKPKNPCKICLTSVNHKNGLQCTGACKTWVHFECLNYTPGKIRDIKKGVIKVTCPCPDCKTQRPKEFRTDSQLSCTNLLCPANRPPKCENYECPINKMIGTSFYGPCDKKACAAHGPGSPGYEEVQFPSSSRNLSGTSGGGYPQGQNCQSQSQGLPGGGSCPPDKCGPLPCQAGCTPVSQDILKSLGEGGGLITPGGDQHQQSSSSAVDAMQQMCCTVNKLAEQINGLMNKMQEMANTANSNTRQCPPSPRKNSPSPCPPQRQQPQQRQQCPGHQQRQQGGGGFNQGAQGAQGPKSYCPKPCYCPNNPKN